MRNDPPIGANYGIWPQILHQVVDTKTQVISIKGVTFCALTSIKHFDQRIIKQLLQVVVIKSNPHSFLTLIA